MKIDITQRAKRLLDKELSPEQRNLFKLVAVENQKGVVTFRMPADIISLETVWIRVTEILDANAIGYRRVNTFATLEEIDDLLSNIDWLWHNWLPGGFNTLLVGDPGVGKSIIALDIAKRVIDGSQFPLEQDVKHTSGNVVWIETEASQQVLNIRAKAFGMNRSKLYLPVIDGDVLGQPDISNTSHREQILQLVEAKEPKLIILDSLGSSQSGGENRKEDIEPVMLFMAGVARDYNTSTLIVHHLRKQGLNESVEVSLDRVRGSSAIAALCRSIIAVTSPQENVVRLSHIKSNLSRKQRPIAVKMQMNDKEDVVAIGYELYQPPEPKKNKKEVVADWVLTQLANEPMPLKILVDLGEANGYTRGNLYAAKDVLGDRIQVGGTGNAAIWSITQRDGEAEDHIIKSMNNHKKKES